MRVPGPQKVVGVLAASVAIGAGFTVTVTGVEYTVRLSEVRITARNVVVAVRLLKASVLEVFVPATSAKPEPLSAWYFTMVPTLLASVRVPELVPAHTAATELVSVPPSELASTKKSLPGIRARVEVTPVAGAVAAAPPMEA